MGILVAMWHEKKRREQLGLLAEELGLVFQPDGDAQHHEQVGLRFHCSAKAAGERSAT